ncbi:hypothetical protein K7432_008900 [Basidiobolus ranarum]|uniref:Uncharacterized protein n=1 Tax=Basidiobolus ranarum TaxID=34480 RepID=A0ABR2WR94_9FUNG
MKKRVKSRVSPKTTKDQDKPGQRTISSYFKTTSENENPPVGTLSTLDQTPASSTESPSKRSIRHTNKAKREKTSPPKSTPKKLSMLERWVIQKVGIVPEAARSGVFEEELGLDIGSSDEEVSLTPLKKAKLGYFSFSPAVNFYKKFEKNLSAEPESPVLSTRDMFLSLIDEPIEFNRDVSPPFMLSQNSDTLEDSSKDEEVDVTLPEEADAILPEEADKKADTPPPDETN